MLLLPRVYPLPTHPFVSQAEQREEFQSYWQLEQKVPSNRSGTRELAEGIEPFAEPTATDPAPIQPPSF